MGGPIRRTTVFWGLWSILGPPSWGKYHISYLGLSWGCLRVLKRSYKDDWGFRLLKSVGFQGLKVNNEIAYEDCKDSMAVPVQASILGLYWGYIIILG